jgi:predicted RNA-binding Zn ribbon-like protein
VQPIPHTLGPVSCLDFVNSRVTDHLGGGAVMDRLVMPEWQAWFVDRWKLGPVHGAPSLPTLEHARETLRRVLERWSRGQLPAPADRKRLDSWIAAAPLRRRFDGHVEPIRRDWTWVLSEVVASAAELMSTTDGRRLKVCANPGCSWMFLDESRNLSRRWCDPTTCGNLVTVREFRRRQRATAGTT